MGLGFSIGCGYIVDYCTKRYPYDAIVIISLIITAISVFFTISIPVEWVAWVATLIIGMSLSVAYSVLITIFSNLVNENEQGWVMGVTGSIMALCFGLTSIFTGVIAQVGAVLPMLLAVAGLAGSAIILAVVRRTRDSAQILNSKH